MFSKSCHYGLQAMLYIAMHSSEDEHIGLTNISSSQEIPKHFLSKILQQLVKNKLLLSMKGPTGGFKLSKPADEITLYDIIKAIDGLDVFTQCGIGFKKCSDEHPCPIHHDYKGVRDKIETLFKTKSLEELVADAERGESIISMSKIQ